MEPSTSLLNEEAVETEPLSRKAQKRQARKLKCKKLAKQRKMDKKPHFDESKFAETSYYAENGLRKVYPYPFTFSTYCKGRWVGKKLVDIVSKEFRAYTVERYRQNIDAGQIKVNGKNVSVDYVLDHNDYISNTIHRHEVPVTIAPVNIIHLSKDLVVVDKPSSIPVHPCGRYRHNSLVFILGKEYNLTELRTLHRLDRLTSGLLFVARNWETAVRVMAEMANRDVQKEYVCRVVGEFPQGSVEVDQPIDVISQKLGIFWIKPTGKVSKTIFERLSCNGRTSVVKCHPLTGRTHQIRVHLQYLGFPIVNDPLYNHPVWGPNLGKGGVYDKDKEQLIADMLVTFNRENFTDECVDITPDTFDANQRSLESKHEEPANHFTNLSTKLPDSACDDTHTESDSVQRTSSSISKAQDVDLDCCNEDDSVSNSESANIPCDSELALKTSNCSSSASMNDAFEDFISEAPMTEIADTLREAAKRQPSEVDQRKLKDTFQSNCPECKEKYRDPKPHELIMYLHALSYKGKDWEYSSKLPEWASPDWEDES